MNQQEVEDIVSAIWAKHNLPPIIDGVSKELVMILVFQCVKEYEKKRGKETDVYIYENMR